MPWRRLLAAVTAVVPLILFGAPMQGAGALQPVSQDRIVSDDPAGFTPNVLDGEVDAVVQIGNRILLGGTFTQVQNANDTATTYTRNDILAFDATTGLLDQSFLPALDGQVTSLAPAADGTSVYVGGAFNNVNGLYSPSLTRLNVADGTTVKAFKAPQFDAIVQDVKLSGNTLYVGGFFTQAKRIGVTVPRTALAAVDATTGEVLTSLNSAFAGASNGGVTQVYKIDINPAATRMMVIGNFSTIDGQDRNQIAMFDLTTSPVALANWQTNAMKPLCYTSFQFYVRDVEFSPDGSYFVLGNTGGYGSGPPSLCDSASRWETAATGTALQPTWIDYTGGDTTYSVGVTGTAVYVGGHQRWWNNPTKADAAGQGAVSRTGIGALDPVNGLPLSWNPTRERGKGVLDFLATSTGLWVASDTDRIGQNYEYHGRIAFFPLAGGKVIPSSSTGSLPSNVYLLGKPGGATQSPVLYRVNAGGPRLLSRDEGPDWATDTASQPSSFHNTGSTAETWTAVGSVDASVPATTPSQVFSSDRVDPSSQPEMQWSFPVATGTPLQVRLYFANRSSSTAQAGKRVFNVAIDSTTVLSNYDIVASSGNNKGVMRSFNITSDGTVNINFTHTVKSDPLIDAIEILRTDLPAPSGQLSTDTVTARSYNGITAGAAKSPSTGGASWHGTRGAVMIGSTLYTGWQDGNLYARSYDGSTFGPATPVDTADQIVPMTTWHSEVPNITSMFFINGRLYYTLAGTASLLYRYFTPESGVVGTTEFTAVSGNLSDLDWTNVQGAFLDGSNFYYVTNSDGVLHRASFAGGVPVAGTSASVSGPSIDGVDWRARGLFLGNFGVLNNPPTASFTSSCTGGQCSFDASASTDDGTITSYAWSFGDGTTGTGKTTSHTYTKGKTYTVTLTLTDDDGVTGSTTGQVTPVVPNVLPSASFALSCSTLTCSFDGTGSTDPDGTIQSYAWDFGDGTGGTGATPSHGYAAPGTYHVTLTVTDDSGGTASVTHDATATAPSTSIAFVGRSGFNGNVSTASVTVPAGVAAGNALLLYETDNNSAATVTGPTGSGWTLVSSVPNGTAVTRMWSKVAVAGDGGSTVSLTLSAISKIDLELVAYSGTSASNPVAAVASTSESTTATGHPSATATVTAGGSWVVSYWGNKSSLTTAWTAPGGQHVRGTAVGSGTAHISSLVTDADAPVPTGSYGGLVATTDDASKATTLTVVLKPAS
ncbi:MAG: PKD domain-containing protein [Frankiaceae bacterium]